MPSQRVPTTQRNTAAPITPIWEVHACAGTLKSGLLYLQPVDDPAHKVLDAWSSSTGKPIAWPRKSPHFSYSAIKSKPDAGFFDIARTSFQIVSDRLRQLIESMDPQAASFHAIRITGPRRASLHTHYWFANWRHRWKCQPDEDVPELNPKAIPARQHLGMGASRGWYEHRLICTNNFKVACKSHAFVGLRFTPTPLASGPDALVRHLPWKSGKSIIIPRCCVPEDRFFDVDEHLKRFPNRTFRSKTPDSNALIDYVKLHSMMDGIAARPLKRLLETGLSINIPPRHTHLSPLVVCIQPKTPEILRVLHKHGAKWNTKNAVGYTALMSAAADANANAVRLLLRFGAKVNATDCAGRNALHQLLDHLEYRPPAMVLQVARILLGAGADARKRDWEGCTPIDLLDRAIADLSPAKRHRFVPLRKAFGKHVR